MSQFNPQEFERGWEDGFAAYHASLPQVCPVMPEAKEEESGLPEYVDAWLLAWAEADMEIQESHAYGLGWHTGSECDDRPGLPCPYTSSRLQSAWCEGYAEGTVCLFSEFATLH